ncbi:transcriptional regulator [Azospirillum sp. TSH7]|uniref:ChrR family anti-sigma-E factor n=1 Tax=unclassified Azospirillum TaxID=2630922 RepID=UPI000D61ABFB|nr:MULTISPECIES: ChrR family anti-sigma-E factor [unclassified Azospirillum]PWC58043.1 transcriptional regulator [Azospirillum sp. TSH7]PWC63212.1 transcriptional regulator [Azospirillum sp. TSH20]
MTARQPAARQLFLPNHHPSDALLVAYGAGSLGEGLSLAVAVHLAHCPDCRATLAEVEALGGALLEDLPPAPLESLSLAATLDRLEREEAPGNPCKAMRIRPRCSRPAGPAAASLPGPLRSYVPSLETLSWQRLAPGVRRVELLPRTSSGGAAQLLRIAPGTALPHHGHGGLELTVVLSGHFADELGRYGPGDLAEVDGDTNHQPIADSHRDCICLIATDAPLRFTGLMGRLMQPFIGL